MKKIIIILASILVAFIVFLGTVYFVAVKNAQKPSDEESLPKEDLSQSAENMFRNPDNATGTENSTTMIGQTITYTTTETGSSGMKTEVLNIIPSSIVLENAGWNGDDVLLSVDSAGESSGGTVAVNFRLITTNAKNAVSVDPADLIRITTNEGQETQARIINGSFSNVAAGQIVSGQLIFFLPNYKDRVIFQIGKEERVLFYEFDFAHQTYRQAEISGLPAENLA